MDCEHLRIVYLKITMLSLQAGRLGGRAAVVLFELRGYPVILLVSL